MNALSAATANRAILVEPGRLIAQKYRVERVLGKGGMGTVYQARHVRLGRRVAIKLLHRRLAEDATHLARFEREASLCGAIEHENVVGVWDVARFDDGRPLIIMEFVEGETLRALLDEQGPLSIPRAVSIARQACAGLAAAHSRGIVHRDVKPENLMLTRRADDSDWVKVVDFGIARPSREASVTTGGVQVGTPHYMAPEAARGELDLDARADVYAIGVILFEMLAGRKPHPEGSYNAVMYHIANSTPPDLGRLRPQVAEALRGVVMHSLCVDRAQRVASCEELARRLEPFEARSRRLSSTAESNTTLTDGRLADATCRPASKSAMNGRLRAGIMGLVSASSLAAAAAAGFHFGSEPERIAARQASSSHPLRTVMASAATSERAIAATPVLSSLPECGESTDLVHAPREPENPRSRQALSGRVVLKKRSFGAAEDGSSKLSGGPEPALSATPPSSTLPDLDRENPYH